jgi:hypothetical protein
VALDDTVCDERDVRSDEGALLGRSAACVYLFSFDTLSETDLLREHAAVWFQGIFTPSQGWCVTGLESRIQLTGGSLEGVTKATAKARRNTVSLTMDAGGSALENARITQRWIQRDGLAHTNVARGTTPGVRTAWTGRSSAPVTTVSGLAYSYDLLTGSPESISYGFSDLSLAAC